MWFKMPEESYTIRRAYSEESPSTQLRSISSRWQTGRTGVFRNPFTPGAFEAGRLIEMKTRENPSGPEATKASTTGRIYGSSCAHRPLPSTSEMLANRRSPYMFEPVKMIRSVAHVPSPRDPAPERYALAPGKATIPGSGSRPFPGRDDEDSRGPIDVVQDAGGVVHDTTSVFRRVTLHPVAEHFITMANRSDRCFQKSVYPRGLRGR